MRFWKVGELAGQTGLTVRTLHHYDKIGLLSPSHRTAAGHRLYTAEDIGRLQQVMSLRRLGFSLDEIRECLTRPDFSPQRVIELHLSRLTEQIAVQQRLRKRLEAVAAHLRAVEVVSAEEFLQVIKEIHMYEKYYTPEQLASLEERRREVGEERIREVEAEWPELIAQLRAEMERGTDPASEPAQRLARRWMALVQEFTGGDAAIARSLDTMYQQESETRERAGIDPELFAYVSKAMEASKGGA